MSLATRNSEYWAAIARHWALLGPPLRPAAPDLAGYMRGIRNFEHPRAAILGVTPELYSLPWPAGSHVIAIDRNPEMIHVVWPGREGTAVCGTWTDMPLASASRDLILCDGGFEMLPYPAKSRDFVREVERVLRPGGAALFRFYVPTDKRETPEEVLDQLHAALVPSLNHLKLRLGMAMESEPGAGVELSRFWSRLHASAPDFAALASKIGWDLDQLLAINAYRGSRNLYYFPRLEQVVDCFESVGLRLEWTQAPDYPMGERCVVACFERSENGNVAR